MPECTVPALKMAQFIPTSDVPNWYPCYCKWIWLRVPMPAIKRIYSMSETVSIMKLWNPPGKESIVKAAKKKTKRSSLIQLQNMSPSIYLKSQIILDRSLFKWSSRTDFDPPKKQSLLKRCHFSGIFWGFWLHAPQPRRSFHGNLRIPDTPPHYKGQ